MLARENGETLCDVFKIYFCFIAIKRRVGSFGIRSIQMQPAQTYVSPRHWHDWDQLTLTAAGSIRIQAGADRWLVPPGHAIWIPAATRHLEQVDAGASAQTLFLAGGLARGLPRHCVPIDASPLLRELMAHIGRIGELNRRNALHTRLADLLIDLLRPAWPSSTTPLQLPELRDPRAKHVAGSLHQHPEKAASIGTLAREAGASTRTIERLFLSETAMTIGDWRRQLRLLHAVEQMGNGARVGAAARAAGYASPSAFIAVFKKVFGTTPKRFSSRNREKQERA